MCPLFFLQFHDIFGSVRYVFNRIHVCRSDRCPTPPQRSSTNTMKNILENHFLGSMLSLQTTLLHFQNACWAKLCPVFNFGVIGIIMAGDQIFPKLGFTAPLPWYYSMRANRFGRIASTWLLGNFLQSFLQSSGAFEVYCNGELVFSKLKEERFPGELN